MYERWTVGDDPKVAPLTVPVLDSENLPHPPQLGFEYPQNMDTNTPYILFVHGYNMKPWEKDRYAETAFKRLYWQGYQGRFGAFDWPTTVQGILNLTSGFDDSEEQAWNSEVELLNLLTVVTL